MAQLNIQNTSSYSKKDSYNFPKSKIEESRNLTASEIEILKKNGCISSDASWNNIFVSKDEFQVELIHDCEFYGTVVIGKLRYATLKYHDLELNCGLYNSYVADCAIGDDVCIRNVKYLVNYEIGNRVILFNIDEMSCTIHSKFGNGILKQDETEAVRIKIGVANENDQRAVLPFEEMIPADAYIWSRFRDDKELMERFVELTEYGNCKKTKTYGIVCNDAVIKNTVLIKDAKIGEFAYIKGAMKLKNITLCSSADEPSQIGEGVEMVNGIMGFGSKVFYQSVAVRFVIGRNCQLKYGARLLNSVLGDNSTVSCCELLNNLIFPFHEQHHNSSFLIATTLLGQSNIAAGATIGSNHNSRSPDGEIIAGRGFWPGLCSDFKHNSKFASFTLVAKGSYENELNIMYPFSLVSKDNKDQGLSIIPAYWFLYNMYAIARNNTKFKKRDKRVIPIQHIETDPLAPDTMEEVIIALNRLIDLTQQTLHSECRQDAKDFLHQNPNSDLILVDMDVQKRQGGRIYKPAQGYKEYRKILKYFGVKCLIEYCQKKGHRTMSKAMLNEICQLPLYTKWNNLGGQIVPAVLVKELIDKIKDKVIINWTQVHDFYNLCQEKYLDYKARFSVYILEWLYARNISDFSEEIYDDILNDVLIVSNNMYESAIISRQKDYTDLFRTMTYSSPEEMTAVLGTVTDNDFLVQLEQETKDFNQNLQVFFSK